MESVALHQSMKKYPANNSFRDAKKLHSHGCVSNITFQQDKERQEIYSVQFKKHLHVSLAQGTSLSEFY